MRQAVAAATVAAILALVTASSAEAQFGKLKKKATDAAASAAGVPTKKPVVVDRIDLTAADLAALEKGLAAEIAAAPGIMKRAEEEQKNREKAQAQYDRDRSAYEKASEKWQACRDKLVEKERPQEEALERKSEAAAGKADVSEDEQASLEAQALKVQEAAQRIAAGTGTEADRKLMADFQKTMAGVQGRGADAISTSNEASAFKRGQAERIVAACGAEPTAPKAPGGGSQMAAEQIQQAGATAAGMEMKGYHIKREQLVSYCGNAVTVAPGAPNSSELNDGLKAACPRVAELQKAGVPI